MKQATAILGLLAQTSIHAGTGQNTGVIDLPIQREGHNGWPCIFGSSFKGALRSRAEAELGSDNKSVLFVFGADIQKADTAGALMVSDARLLLLPIRSLTSQFKWVTCATAINRFQMDAARFGQKINEITVPKLSNGEEEEKALIPIQSKEGDLFLEEYRFKATSANLDSLIKQLAQLMPQSDAEQQLQQQLAIVSDDMFSHLVRHATPVNAHIAIDSETKIVKSGALWYEETLPPETLLYAGLSATPPRATQEQKRGQVLLEADDTADWVLNSIIQLFAEKPWLQVGGNETVGMGWFAVKPFQGDK